jgi:hypothetical protein
MTNVPFDRRSLDAKTEFADLFAENAADFRVERFELDHSGDYRC